MQINYIKDVVSKADNFVHFLIHSPRSPSEGHILQIMHFVLIFFFFFFSRLSTLQPLHFCHFNYYHNFIIPFFVHVISSNFSIANSLLFHHHLNFLPKLILIKIFKPKLYSRYLILEAFSALCLESLYL